MIRVLNHKYKQKFKKLVTRLQYRMPAFKERRQSRLNKELSNKSKIHK
jgi:hypothetical protein